jgi:hypothetical protein
VFPGQVLEGMCVILVCRHKLHGIVVALRHTMSLCRLFPCNAIVETRILLCLCSRQGKGE